VKPRSDGEHHYLWQDGETTEVWPRDEEQYPKVEFIDASRGGDFLMRVSYKSGDPLTLTEEYGS